MEYVVYWYKRPNFNNPYTEGYVGITNDIHRRNNEHRRNTKFSHFTNALKLYNDIFYVILHEGLTLEEASEIEYSYRPSTNIGWNSAIGGMDTLSKITTPIILYHESNPDKLYKFESIVSASKELDISQGRLNQAMSRKSTVYGYDGWAICFDENVDRSKTKSISEAAKLKSLGIKRTKSSHFKGKQRWSEKDKERISMQHKGKTISESQKAIVRAKNRANHTSCKEVVLKHISEPNKEYLFHSISEAARQLNIPLPRLKSKASRPLNVYGKDGWAIVYLGSN